MTRIAALAGGVGGAKLIYGFSKILPSEDFCAIVNTGDDFIHFGLNISPDIDSVCYSLAELSNEKTGWGRANESWNCHDELQRISSENWFQLGDKDLALHLERTRLISNGSSLTQATKEICNQLGIRTQILPMTDNKVSTMITTEEYGEISFQEYFVKHQFQPKILSYRYAGIENAAISPYVRDVLELADVIILCPSNPWLSILPIISLQGVQKILGNKITIAVSPIVGNSAIKGPAAKIFLEMGIEPSAVEIAKIYKEYIKGFVLDELNRNESSTISSWGIIPFVTNTIMKDSSTKISLAERILRFIEKFNKDN